MPRKDSNNIRRIYNRNDKIRIHLESCTKFLGNNNISKKNVKQKPTVLKRKTVGVDYASLLNYSPLEHIHINLRNTSSNSQIFWQIKKLTKNRLNTLCPSFLIIIKYF